MEGRYANYFEIGYTKYEIYLDFGHFDPDSQKGVRHSRMLLNPASALIFFKMLESVLRQYESEVGRIET